KTVTISGLTLTRGNDPLGAAMAIQGGRVTLNGDHLTGNVSGGTNTDGFGVINDTGNRAGALTITDCSFAGNKVGGGGSNGVGFGVVDFNVLANNASLTIADTVISRNTTGGDGGTGFGTVDF